MGQVCTQSWTVVQTIALACLLTACAESRFTNKDDLLASSKVMGTDGSTNVNQNGNNQGSANVIQIGNNNGSTGVGQNGGNGAGTNTGQNGNNGAGTNTGQSGNNGAGVTVPQNGFNSIPVVLWCSDRRFPNQTSLKEAMADSSISVALKVNDKMCNVDRNALMADFAAGSFKIGNYCASALRADGNNRIDIVINGVVTKMRKGDNSKVMDVFYARNRKSTNANDTKDDVCDKVASPLVVHMASDPSNPQPIRLSSQRKGIDFDLLGEKNNHRDVRISWFTNRDYRMLALPNVAGQVNGIDELFGDNTMGPDGEFAANGYAALAKYDLNRDGRIDAKDAIYNELRLWLDLDRNGHSRERELTTLRDAQIEYIDLVYSEDFSESDSYGNVTKMKSVVGYKDGTLDLIFDLWFKYF